jgi:hypothetical protein
MTTDKPQVEIRTFTEAYDGRRRGRVITWHQVFVNNVPVTRGLPKREAERKKVAIEKDAGLSLSIR